MRAHVVQRILCAFSTEERFESPPPHPPSCSLPESLSVCFGRKRADEMSSTHTHTSPYRPTESSIRFILLFDFIPSTVLNLRDMEFNTSHLRRLLIVAQKAFLSCRYSNYSSLRWELYSNRMSSLDWDCLQTNQALKAPSATESRGNHTNKDRVRNLWKLSQRSNRT